MNDDFLQEHARLTRRFFLQCSAAGTALATLPAAAPPARNRSPELTKAVDSLKYLTPPEEFGTVERGNPLPYTLPAEKLREVGLVRETWKLEVAAGDEPDVPRPKLGRPLIKKDGTALDFGALLKLADKHAVRFLKMMTCNNIASPLGMGLWEGVPLRDVIWMAKPRENVRRVWYNGYHNDKPRQMFRSSLPVGRVLEDPPGLPPVILCYKLNGKLLSGKRGGPVRIVVPEAYGFKSVKWLSNVVLSNLPHANDTYARGNNDLHSPMKTFARFIFKPSRAKTGQAVPVTGLAQVGISGLKTVQVWVTSKTTKLSPDDPYFTKADWQDAEVLGPPKSWDGGLPEGKLEFPLHGFDEKTRRPQSWPMPLTLAHWAFLLPPLPAGKYDVRCRTIDANDRAQPMPRPFRKSGRNEIQRSTLNVEA